MFINMGTSIYFLWQKNVMETVWYDRKMSVAVLVCVEEGKCFYINGFVLCFVVRYFMSILVLQSS